MKLLLIGFVLFIASCGPTQRESEIAGCIKGIQPLIKIGILRLLDPSHDVQYCTHQIDNVENETE